MRRRSVFLLAFLMAGCGTADNGGSEEGDPCEIAEQGSQRCSGSVIQTCEGTAWTNGVDCSSTSQTCAMTSSTTAECESPSCDITVGDNEDFVIEGRDMVIYTDVFWDLPPGVPQPNIILITHEHSDHFNVDLVTSIAAESGATVVGPEPVTTLLVDVPNQQLVTLQPDALGSSISTTVEGVSITAYYTYHTPQHNSYKVVIDGVSFLFDGDNEDIDLFASYPELNDLDIAFLAFVPLEQFHTTYSPEVIIEMHLGGGCNGYEDFPDFTGLGYGQTYSYQAH